MITAKVSCVSKTETGEGDERYANVTLGADYNDGRNAEWAKWTPSMSVTMTLNGRAAALFEAGKKYTLQFVEESAEDVPPSE